MKMQSAKKTFATTLWSAAAFVMFSLLGCNASDEISDLADLATNPPEQKEINRSKLGVHNFFNYRETFGDVDTQFRDIRSNLGIRYVRILVPWIEQLQSGPTAGFDFSQADSILNSIPAGVDVLVVLAHTPTWFSNQSNWINGDPRTTWVENFLKPVVTRYSSTPGIVGWEIFNEPDVVTVSSDVNLELQDPDKYYDLLQKASAAVRAIDPERLVVMAASRSIQQNWPNNFNYNKRLKELGAENHTDIWNVHYYGKQYEKVVSTDGVADFLNGITKPIWITESGQQGPNNQRAYVQEVWPYLEEKIPSIERIYYYEYASVAPPPQSFGLRSNDNGFSVSDLYVWLRDEN